MFFDYRLDQLLLHDTKSFVRKVANAFDRTWNRLRFDSIARKISLRKAIYIQFEPPSKKENVKMTLY